MWAVEDASDLFWLVCVELFLFLPYHPPLIPFTFPFPLSPLPLSRSSLDSWKRSSPSAKQVFIPRGLKTTSVHVHSTSAHLFFLVLVLVSCLRYFFFTVFCFILSLSFFSFFLFSLFFRFFFCKEYISRYRKSRKKWLRISRQQQELHHDQCEQQ